MRLRSLATNNSDSEEFSGVKKKLKSVKLNGNGHIKDIILKKKKNEMYAQWCDQILLEML